MYRIAVCDDDAADRGATIGALGGYFEAKSLPCEFTEFCSAEEFLHPRAHIASIWPSSTW